MPGPDPLAQPAYLSFVLQGADWGAERGDEDARVTQRIANQVRLVVEPHGCAGYERTQIQGVKVELTPNLGICREKNLKAAIEDEAFDSVGPNTTTNPVRSLQQDCVTAAALQFKHCAQAGKTCAYHHDVRAPGEIGGIVCAHWPFRVRRIVSAKEWGMASQCIANATLEAQRDNQSARRSA